MSIISYADCVFGNKERRLVWGDTIIVHPMILFKNTINNKSTAVTQEAAFEKSFYYTVHFRLSSLAKRLQSWPKIRPSNRLKYIGGIDRTALTVPLGVTVLRGNATKRTSFLQAIMAALGSTRATLKGDADEGRVELDDRTYEWCLECLDNQSRSGGGPYLDDPEIADLFAFVLEPNETRQAVACGQDLRYHIIRR
jgi:hypothetical protein